MERRRLGTSISLPRKTARAWRRNRKLIIDFVGRFLRTQMRQPPRRGVTRTYNRTKGLYVIINIRLLPDEYDALHCTASALRISVSSLIHNLIRFWLKPARRAKVRRLRANYGFKAIIWNGRTGIVQEELRFKLITPKNPDEYAAAA